MSYEKLRPCPKCGKDGNNLKLRPRLSHSQICVVCVDCNLKGPWMYYTAAAIHEWNMMERKRQ